MQNGDGSLERRAWSVEDAAAMYGISKGFIWNQIRSGVIPIQRVGRRVLILDRELRKFFNDPSKDYVVNGKKEEEMPVAQSSHLQSYDYDIESQTLTIQFQNGSTYTYSGVPLTEFNNMVQSGGAGTYFWSKIRNNYPTTRLSGPGR
jgi:excisionase family DNA binding protein